jgi:hypothetical protein
MMLKISVEQLYCVQFLPSNDATPGILPLGETACIAQILQIDWHNTYGRGGMINYQTRKGISTEQIYVAIYAVSIRFTIGQSFLSFQLLRRCGSKPHPNMCSAWGIYSATRHLVRRSEPLDSSTRFIIIQL